MSFLQYCLLIPTIFFSLPGLAQSNTPDIAAVLRWHYEENLAGLTGSGFREMSAELKAHEDSFHKIIEQAISEGDKESLGLILDVLSSTLHPYEVDQVPREDRRWYKTSSSITFVPMDWAISKYLKAHPPSDLFFQQLLELVFQTTNVAEMASITFLLSDPKIFKSVQDPVLRADIKDTLMFLTLHPCPIVRSNSFTGLAAFVAENKDVEERLRRSLEMPMFHLGRFSESEFNHYNTAAEIHKRKIGLSKPEWREKATASILKFQTTLTKTYKKIRRGEMDLMDYNMELQALSAAGQALIWAAGQRKFSKPVPPIEKNFTEAYQMATPVFDRSQHDVTRYLNSGVYRLEKKSNMQSRVGGNAFFPAPWVFTGKPTDYWIALSKPEGELKNSLKRIISEPLKMQFGDLGSLKAWLKYRLYDLYPPRAYYETLRAAIIELFNPPEIKDHDPDAAKTGSAAADNDDLWVMHPKKIVALRSLALLGDSPLWIQQELEKILPHFMPMIDPNINAEAQMDYHMESLDLIVETLKWVNPNDQAFRNKITLWLNRIKSPELKAYVKTHIIPKTVFNAEAEDSKCEVILLPFGRMKP